MAESKDTKVEVVEIVKLSDRFGYVGSRGLISGDIQEKPQYCVMTLVDGFMKLQMLDATEWLIKEIDDDSKPRIEYVKKKIEVEGFLSMLAHAVSKDGYYVDKKIIYVPMGTVIEDYKIDMS